MDTIINLPSVQDYCRLLGTKAQYPLVSVIDMSELPQMVHSVKNFGFYCIYYKEINCGEMLYGRNKYDYEEGTMMFIGANQIAGANDGMTVKNPKGWILMFHPDLLIGTTLAGRMKDYSFFGYDSNEALHMSDREKTIILNCFREIREELDHAIDKHTKHIVASNIETMLNHCVRFYDRQFITREIINADIMARFDKVLSDYLNSGKAASQGLPTVKFCAEEVCLSPNYFGDLVKKSTGTTAIEHIHLFALKCAKTMLAETNKTVSEIAYTLGFNYPHHLTRLFKKHFKITPMEYRAISI